MLRLETKTGWWLVTHRDHARLAGAFAERWGNDVFEGPEPRENVLRAIMRHDDTWAARDTAPQITKEGKPNAFSVELVGRYVALEEIDLADYVAVRDRAARLIAEEDPYAAILIAMHTYSLLNDHADRSTLGPEQLPLLDDFLTQQLDFRKTLRQRIETDPRFPSELRSEKAIFDQFCLLQACDILSVLVCVDFRGSADLWHPLPTRSGGHVPVQMRSIAFRHFELTPYPFSDSALTFQFPARHVKGKVFSSAAELQHALNAAPVEILSVTFKAA